MITSIAGTVTPLSLARRARSYALSHTALSIGSSGSARANSRRTLFSRCPRAPFQSSSCTGGHQRACPEVNAASTRARAPGSPLGRSMWIHDDVSTRIIKSTLPASGLKFLRRHQICTGTGKPCELRHAHATVEVRNGTNYGLAFCLRLSEPDGILEYVIGNVYSGLHTSRIAPFGFLLKSSSILSLCVLASSEVYGGSEKCFASRSLRPVPLRFGIQRHCGLQEPGPDAMD